MKLFIRFIFVIFIIAASILVWMVLQGDFSSSENTQSMFVNDVYYSSNLQNNGNFSQVYTPKQNDDVDGSYDDEDLAMAHVSEARESYLENAIRTRKLTQDEQDEVYQIVKADRLRELSQYRRGPRLAYINAHVRICDWNDKSCMGEPKISKDTRLSMGAFEPYHDSMLYYCTHGKTEACVDLYEFLNKNMIVESHVPYSYQQKYQYSQGILGLLEYACWKHNADACVELSNIGTINDVQYARNLVLLRRACLDDHEYCVDALEFNSNGVFLDFNTENNQGYALENSDSYSKDLPKDLQLLRENNWTEEQTENKKIIEIYCKDHRDRNYCS